MTRMVSKIAMVVKVYVGRTCLISLNLSSAYCQQLEEMVAEKIEVFSATDYAGCTKARRSTTGGIMRWGRCILKGWSSTQATVALSSGDAEYYGMVK